MDLDELIARDRWFHAIDFGGGRVSRGRFVANRPQNYTLYGVMRLLERIDATGLDCPDIGTMDGLVAFILKRAGAKHVVATDMEARPTFLAGRAALGLDIDYRAPVRIDALASCVGRRRFDLVVCAGVLYHLFEPLTALVLCREALALDGLLIVETHYRHDESRPTLTFSPADVDRGSRHVNTFFWPSADALSGMLEVAGFEIVASIAVGSRLTMLARASRPSELRSPRPMVRNILTAHGRDPHYGERIDYRAMEAQTERSPARYAGRPGSAEFICASRFKTRFDLQPVFSTSGPRSLLLLAAETRSRLRTAVARRRWLPLCNAAGG